MQLDIGLFFSHHVGGKMAFQRYIEKKQTANPVDQNKERYD